MKSDKSSAANLAQGTLQGKCLLRSLRRWRAAFHLAIALLTARPGQVLMLPHVLDLTLHGEEGQCDEVHEQNWPEHRDVEDLEERHEEGDHRRLRRLVPEFELGHAPRERSELAG